MSKDNDDVMDFINSLPDSNTEAASKDTNNEDFLEFLDELNSQEKTGTSKGKLGPKAKKSGKSASGEKSESPKKADSESKQEPEPEKKENVNPQNIDPVHKEETNKEADDGEQGGDPISSISSWWSSEGSKQVLSLWGSLTSNAHQLSESTYQLASQTSTQLSHQRQKLLKENEGEEGSDQVLHLTSKLNLILSTMSQQIREGLIDREDELMNILLVHDLSNIDFLDRICLGRFNRVMNQVEGGIKVSVSDFNHRHENHRMEKKSYYDLALFHGKMIDGEKLCYANLDSSIKNYKAISRPEKQENEKQENKQENKQEENVDVNTSDIFIAIQPISTGTADQQDRDSSAPTQIEANDHHSFSFTLILKDITNSITIATKSQPFPLRWARWVGGDNGDIEEAFGKTEDDEGVDPSEWVKEWLQDGLSLAFAVLAQEYVTKRMGL